MKQVNVYLFDKQIGVLKDLSKNNRLKVAEHVSRTIDKYFENQRGK